MKRTAALFPFAVSVMGIALAACGTVHGTPHPVPVPTPVSKRVQDWALNGGYGLVETLTGDLNSMEADFNAGDMEGLASDAASLRSDARTAEASAPIPDPELQLHWAAALGDYEDAASLCIAGDYDNSGKSLEDAGANLRAMLPRMNSFGVSV